MKIPAKRVVIVGENRKLIGIYAVNELPITVRNSCIVFPNKSDSGNTICLNNESFPNAAWVDGENIELFN